MVLSASETAAGHPRFSPRTRRNLGLGLQTWLLASLTVHVVVSCFLGERASNEGAALLCLRLSLSLIVVVQLLSFRQLGKASHG